MPTLDYDLITDDGKLGWTASWFAHESDESMTPLKEPLKTQYVDETRMFIRYVWCFCCGTSISHRLSTSYPENITKRWTLKLDGQLKPRDQDTLFEFGLIAAGRAKVCSVPC